MTQIDRLRAAEVFDPATGCHYAWYDRFDELATQPQPHMHDFYEVFYLAEGSVWHLVNGEDVVLTTGALVLVRPDDMHTYRRSGTQPCRLVNIAFSTQTFFALLHFFDVSTSLHTLETAHRPPTVYLPVEERERFKTRLEALRWLPYNDKAGQKREMLACLAEIFARTFLADQPASPEIQPAWLAYLCQQMQKPAHFIEGRTALLRLAQRSEEHVGRVFQQQLGITPTYFINTLRLEYAAHLLTCTDHTILAIAYEVGFANLSYFYRLFHQHFQLSPAAFRQARKKDLIPLS